MKNQNRRNFIKTIGATAAALTLPSMSGNQVNAADVLPSRNPLPRWKGFNLQYLYRTGRSVQEPDEDHFRWIADWGFNFVRLPMNYRVWVKPRANPDLQATPEELCQVDESKLALVDKAVEFGAKHGIHVCLCFHHAPGYHIGIGRNSEEPFQLWRDQSAVEVFTYHWDLFARRYKASAKDKISFNLFNEAPWPNDDFHGGIYREAITPAVEAIRRVTPDRIIIADGAGAGNLSVPELIPLGIAQSVHCYIPGILSHYKVDWMQNRKDWPEPKWPGAVDEAGYTWDRAHLERYYAPWKDLADQGIGVHMGETSGSNRVPHPIFLAWLGDVLGMCKTFDIGYALWDFIGASKFGILDSSRADVDYEDWHGHKLDRKMLELVQNS